MFFARFSDSAQQIPSLAQEEAVKLNHNYIGTEHILLGLIREDSGTAAQALKNLGLDLEKLRAEVEKSANSKVKTPVKDINFTASSLKALELAVTEAFNLGQDYVGTEHLLVGLLREGRGGAVKVLHNLNIDPESVFNEVVRLLGGEVHQQKNEAGKGQNSQQGSVIEEFGIDLTALAGEGKLEPVIGREREIERMMQILSRRTKNNPCLVGEAGVGKTALAEGLAQQVVKEDVPENLQDKRVVQLEMASLVAGTKYRGEFEERLQNLVSEVVNDANIILFIDELHTVIGGGAAEGAIDASNIIKPSLAKGDLQVIGATTLDEYRKNIERDAALERRFQPVMVEEPTEDESMEIIKGLRERYETHHQVEITDEALEAAVKYSSRYIQDRYLPDKAIDLVDEASSVVRVNNSSLPDGYKEIEEKLKNATWKKDEAINEEDFEKAAELRDEEEQLQQELEKLKGNSQEEDKTTCYGKVTEEDIARVVSSWTGIPIKKLTEEESSRLLRMENILHSRVIGQHEAVQAVSRAIRRGRAGLKDPKRPIGSFMFLGPTGVGKTELARSLAEALFGEEDAMIRLDMSEFMEKHTTSRLVGSPPGYVGYEEGGQLTEKVRQRPYSVILLDEIEKAHPDVFNILLQILEDGRLTDGKGRTVNFQNTVIIMTSNVGAGSLKKQQAVGFRAPEEDKDYEEMKNRLMEELHRTFRPEFLNRLDDVIVFQNLSEKELAQIVELMLEDLSRRISEFGFKLSVSEKAKELLAAEGYDPSYGARPLRRAIQKRLEDGLSEELLKGTFNPGDNIEVDVEEKEGKTQLVFNRKQDKENIWESKKQSQYV